MSNLKIGDKVVMNDRYYDERKGEVFTIKAGPEIIGRTECFWLDGYSGAYCADGLDLYKPPTNEEWFCSLPTEEKAKILVGAIKDCGWCLDGGQPRKWSFCGDSMKSCPAESVENIG